jgi:hypothetical protein
LFHCALIVAWALAGCGGGTDGVALARYPLALGTAMVDGQQSGGVTFDVIDSMPAPSAPASSIGGFAVGGPANMTAEQPSVGLVAVSASTQEPVGAIPASVVAPMVSSEGPSSGGAIGAIGATAAVAAAATAPTAGTTDPAPLPVVAATAAATAASTEAAPTVADPTSPSLVLAATTTDPSSTSSTTSSLAAASVTAAPLAAKTAPAGVLDAARDPRTTVVVDADRTAAQQPKYALVNLHGPSMTATAPNVGQRPWRLNEIPELGYRHADGSAWIKRETRPDGKSAFTLRIRKGQPVYAVGNDPATAALSHRAEISTEEGPGWENSMIDEDRGEYWIGLDYWFDADMAANQGGLSINDGHKVSWRTGKYFSDGHPLGLLVGGTTVYFRIHGPGSTGSFAYDVRTTPLSTQVVSTDGPTGGQHGINHLWAIANTPDLIGKSFKLVARVRYGNMAYKNPRTEVWRKIGDGPLVKIIDVNHPNTFSEGYRYAKVGLYSWDPSDAFYGSAGTRTIRMRSVLWIRDEPSPGRPKLGQDVITNWLQR